MRLRLLIFSAVAACVGLLAGLGMGCSQYKDSRVPEPIQPFVEPEREGDYLLYRPSSYDRQLAWPVIVVCHGAFPDTANRQIRAWTELAESEGFIVIAPELKSSRGTFAGGASKQLDRLRDDEKHILASLRHVRGGHNISEDRIFIYGWSEGAYAALHVGIRNQQVFRGIAVAQPEFDSSYLGQAAEDIDYQQPILVSYPISDYITGRAGSDLAEWLRDHGAYVQESTAGPVRRTECKRIVDWIENVLRREVWVVIRATPSTTDSREVHFSLQTSARPASYRWKFGDGGESNIADPAHRYAEPGTYRVEVDVQGSGGQTLHRTCDVVIP